jgi:hypothetical protein
VNTRERYLAICAFEPPDKPLVRAIGGWAETGERWVREGWDGSGLDAIFGTDTILGTGVYYGPVPPFEYKLVEEDETTRVYINHEGILMREFKDYSGNSSMPQFVRFPVENEADFEAFCAERLQPTLEGRVPGHWADVLPVLNSGEYPVSNFADRWGGFFGPLRNLMGVENLCTAFYDNPALITRMMDQRVEAMIEITAPILDQVQMDTFMFWEDMAYKTASLLSPAMFRKYMVPRYAEVTAWLRSRGVKHVGVDSDGDIRELIPLWLEAGLDLIVPFEVAAGMDVVEMRREYGHDLIMMGGIDKRAVALGGQTMRDEVDRIVPVVESGGYFPELDHSAPPDISWPNMQEYMHYLLERLGRG